MKTTQSHSPSSNGFTLVEISLGIVLIAIILMGLSSMVLTGNRVAAKSNRVSIATSVGAEALEEVKVSLAAQTEFDLLSSRLASGGADSTRTLPTQTIDKTAYTRTVVYSLQGPMVKVSVVVSWTDPDGNLRSSKLSTTIGKVTLG